jgi:hypothetical protein
MNSLQQNHGTPLTDETSIRSALADIDQRITGCGFYSRLDVPDPDGGTAYPIEEIPGNCIIVLSSFDFAYYHDLEMIFYDVMDHNIDPERHWPDHYQHQVELLKQDENDYFHFRLNSQNDEHYLVTAKGFSYYFGSVYYGAKNGELTENERFAWWKQR